MIEMIKLDDLMVRVSSFQRKIPENPQVFEIVFLVPGQSGYRDIDHILNQHQISLTIFSEDDAPETHQVTVDRHDIASIGPEIAPRTRHFLVLKEAVGVTDEEIAAAFAEVEAAVKRVRDVLAGMGVLDGRQA